MTNPKARRALLNTSALAAAIALSFAATGAAMAQVRAYDIPSEPLSKALRDFGQVSGRQIIFTEDLVRGHATPGLRGDYSSDDALARLLTGTGLRSELSPSGAIMIERSAGPQALGAQAEPATNVAEVVVTGTSIRGVKPIAPVQEITHEDIERSGYADVGDVMRSLPEDFAGGENPGTTTATGVNNNQNDSNASTVNLLGLGSDATLALINGHRMPGDAFFQGADISVIPLGAIQRVEVVTDGSSAIYGSDAVAGVVNFILRKDYDGLEASARYGGATDGGGEETTYSILGGIVKDRWHVLVSAEYQHQEEITAAQRDYTSAFPGDSLIQPSTTRSVLVSGGVDIANNISFSVDGLYSDRLADSFFGVTHSYFVTGQVHTPNYNVAATLDFKLPRNWDLSLVGTVAGSSNALSGQEDYGGTLYPSTTNYSNDVSSVEVSANGKALTLPTGDLRMAIGAGYRHEGFSQVEPGAFVANLHPSRGIDYVYGEALVPLIPASADRLGLQELELSASGRYEYYSDVGAAANPKLGLRYVPFDGLNIRGSWGTSFKAPSFTQLYGQELVYYWPTNYIGGTGVGNALTTYGSNPDLKPERSRNWTIGADYSPPNSPSMVISVTYFNIDYTNRIVQPVEPAYYDGLSNSANAPFITLNPSAALDQSVLNSVPANSFENFVGAPFNAATVVAIERDNYQNAEAQVDTGIDVSYRQSFVSRVGDIKTFANAAWNHLTQQISSTIPAQTLSGTAFNVPKFRARGGASWSNDGLAATALVNYTASETNTNVTPNETVASWTTVDANLLYKFPDTTGLRRGLALTLSATNLFDRKPPYVAGYAGFSGVYFDSLNASAVGRFIAFQVSKKW